MGKVDYELKQQGKQAYFNGDFEEAIRFFSEALKIKQHDPNLYGLRCTAYNKLQKYQEALDDVTKMLELRPYNYKGYLIQGSCQFHLAKYDDAVESYAKALQAQPSQDIARTVAEAMAKINFHRKRSGPVRSESMGTILSAEERAVRIQRFRQHCSAIRIQCWWKGYEVRKKLGDQIQALRKKVREEYKARETAKLVDKLHVESENLNTTKDEDYETASENESSESEVESDEGEQTVQEKKEEEKTVTEQPATKTTQSTTTTTKKTKIVTKKPTKAPAKVTKNGSSQSLVLDSKPPLKKQESSKKKLRNSPSAPVLSKAEKPEKLNRTGPRFTKSGQLTVKITNPKQLEKINNLTSIYLTPSSVVDSKIHHKAVAKDGWESQMKDFLI